jgi:hypothetical protein
MCLPDLCSWSTSWELCRWKEEVNVRMGSGRVVRTCDIKFGCDVRSQILDVLYYPEYTHSIRPDRSLD